ncbi:MAG: Hpt domain-containing protein [Lachnospiraceae bacterium]|nr:Hpt domain-containing protein [Lachnospiraceae bacterium]
MDELLKEQLEENGANIEAAINRFMGNEEVLLKFLLGLKEDENFPQLRASLEEENFAEAFKRAHSIKGVYANLGLDPIAGAASAMTELLRGREAEEIDREELWEMNEALEEAYELFLDLIDEYA